MSATQIFPALDAATEAALRASIERFGVIVPVVVDQHGQLLDGHHRARIAGELGVEFEMATRFVADEDEALEIARTLNADRRHLTAEQRREMTLALAQDGHSERAIAGALGFGKTTIHRDIAAAGGPLGPPAVTTGLDGKKYPGRREPELYYGKGDKYAESITPVTRYFQAWRKRDFRFSHLNPREASKRLRQLDQLAADIDAARDDLKQRATPARMRV